MMKMMGMMRLDADDNTSDDDSAHGNASAASLSQQHAGEGFPQEPDEFGTFVGAEPQR